MKKPFLSFLFCLAGYISFGQFIISGKVTDAASKEPLEGASVFAQNTTKGTTTDASGQFQLNLEQGGYELIISFTGYISQVASIEKANNQNLIVELEREDNSMEEVIIRNSYEVENGYEIYGDFFLKHFIGSTPFAAACTLLNPSALKFFFYKSNDRLKIRATEPLQVVNNALGYTLRYQLDSFVYYFRNDINLYRGTCLYQLMEGSPEQMNLWESNRRQAYYGSRLHFLRSYYDSTLHQEGFNVDILSTNVINKFDRLVNPYVPEYYYYDDSTYDAELWFPRRVSIVYSRKAPEQEYLQRYDLPLNVNLQISYIDFLDAIIIKRNGFFFDQGSLVNQGYWSWKNIADQLPYDYDPDE